MFHLDFNGLNFEKPDVLSSTLNDYLAKWENEYLVENSSDLDFGRRFCNILEQVHRQTGKVVLSWWTNTTNRCSM